MKILDIILTCVILSGCCKTFAWEDDPRLEEHNRLTDMLIAFGDIQAVNKEKQKMQFVLQPEPDDEEKENE